MRQGPGETELHARGHQHQVVGARRDRGDKGENREGGQNIEMDGQRLAPPVGAWTRFLCARKPARFGQRSNFDP
jgi:hypothetical protein